MEIVELISEDGQPFRITRALLSKIGIFRVQCQEPDITTFPLHAVTSNILAKVIEYLNIHADDDIDASSEYTPYADLQSPKDRAFVQAMDLACLVEVSKAANYMDVPELLELSCRAIAQHMRGLTTEQLRAKFNIVNDFSKEEEERLRNDTSWCIDY